MQNCQNAKNCKKIAIFLKIAKNRGRNFPEGQVRILLESEKSYSIELFNFQIFVKQNKNVVLPYSH